MRARDHTRAMLHAWRQAAITHVDIALGRNNGTMIWHHQVPIQQLPLAWLRAENVHCGEVYIRPTGTQPWPMVFLDDLPPLRALRIAQKYHALVVQTSPAGGCHLWLQLTRALGQHQRYQVQRWLIPRLNADPGSVSGEHLGRLAGLRNWKRHGVWVNVLNPYPSPRPPWNPAPALQAKLPRPSRPKKTAPRDYPGKDYSESAREWGWVCGALAAGLEPQQVYQQLLQRASPRRQQDAQRYARYTLQRALRRLR